MQRSGQQRKFRVESNALDPLAIMRSDELLPLLFGRGDVRLAFELCEHLHRGLHVLLRLRVEVFEGNTSRPSMRACGKVKKL